MKKLFTFLCLLALALPGRALTSTNSVTVTNNLGGPLTLSLYSVAAGSYTLAGLQTIATNGSATLTGSGTNWAGALVLNTNNNLAVVVSWNAWASNVFTTSYLLSVGVHQIISIGGAGAPGGITSGGSTTNPPSLNTNTPGVSTNPPSVTQLPVSVLVGTNPPNGIVTAAYGSIYNQFDGTGTNYVQSWIKQKSAGNTNWVAYYNPGNVTYANGQAIPNTLGLVYPDGHQAASVANGADNLYANWAFISQGIVGPVGASNIVGSLPIAQVSGAGTAATLSSNSVLAMAAVQAGQLISTSAISSGNLTGTVTNFVFKTLGGTNDDTFAFTTAFNSSRPAMCPVGDFNVTNIVITNDNEYIVGYGCRLHMGTNAIGYTLSARYMTNVVIQGLSVYGGIYQQPGWTFSSGISGPLINCYYLTSPGNGVSSGNGTPTNARSGFFLPTLGRNVYADLYAEGYNVSGYYFSNPNNSGSMYAPLAKTEDLRASWCLIGFNTAPVAGGNACMDFTTNNSQYLYYDSGALIKGAGSPDYLDLQSPMAQFCSVGIFNSVWNLKVLGAECSSNYIDFASQGGEFHGSVVGGHFNHDIAAAVYCVNANHANDDGATFSGLTTEGGAELWYVCQNAGLLVTGCRIGGPIISTNNSGVVAFVGCYTNAASGGFTSDGTGLIMPLCFSPTETNASLIPITGSFTTASLTLTNSAAAPAVTAGTGRFWPSNTALYWVTPTHTNYITGP